MVLHAKKGKRESAISVALGSKGLTETSKPTSSSLLMQL